MDDNRMVKETLSFGHLGMKSMIKSFRYYKIVDKESRSGYVGSDNRMFKETISFGISYLGYDLVSSVCAVIFITLVLLDVWKAFRRKASWIPGKALALSALTIQLLLFSDHLDVSITSSNQHLQNMQLILLVEEQLLIDSRRVMFCVFIAYLLPGIVSEGLKSVWGNVGALALIVIAHMSYEAYFLLKCPGWEGSHDFYDYSPTGQPGMQLPYQGSQDFYHYSIPIPSYIALSVAIILLVVLLSCAVIAGKTIRNIMSQKVPLALSCCCSSAEDRLCENIEDHVLKAWIVVRASQPDYIIARSVFTAFAGVVVTICFVLLVVKWIYVPLPPLPVTPVYAFQFAFVVVGSMVVVFRWLTAVFYFPKDVRCFFYFEDFWTRSLVQQKEDLRGWLLFLSLLPTMLIWVQKFMVLLSKVCWFLSQFAFGKIRPFIMSKNKSEFSKYSEVLETIRMPGENADSLWRANESAFEKTQNHFKNGIENGKNSSKELISLMEYKTGAPEHEAPTTLEEEKHFKMVGKMSWKMRAVSLIHLMIYFYDGTDSDVVNDCIKACRQAWCFMDMVDRSDPEAKLVSEAADNEFNTLENVWKKHRKIQSLQNSKRNQSDEVEGENRGHNQWEEARSNNLLERKIKKPLKENMERLSKEEANDKEGNGNPCLDTLHDSKDFKTVAAEISLYKFWKAKDLNSNSDYSIHDLRSLLANVICHCLEEEVLNKAIRKNCNKWAEEGEENEIFNAASITGKAKGVRQEIREGKDKDAVRVPVEGVEVCTVRDQVESRLCSSQKIREGKDKDAVRVPVEGVEG